MHWLDPSWIWFLWIPVAIGIYTLAKGRWLERIGWTTVKASTPGMPAKCYIFLLLYS